MLIIAEYGEIMDSNSEDQDIEGGAPLIEVTKFLFEARQRLDQVTSRDQSQKETEEQGLHATKEVTRLDLEQFQITIEQ